MLVTRSRMQTEDNQLTDRARHWIDGIQEHFAGTPVPSEQHPPAGALAFKTA